MSPETVDIIIKVVPVCITALVGAITTCVMTVRSGKWKNLFRKIPAVNTHTQKLVELIEEAEKHNAYTGSDKLTYVVTHYVEYCIKEKIQYDEEAIKENVESLVAMTKKVNTGKSHLSQEY